MNLRDRLIKIYEDEQKADKFIELLNTKLERYKGLSNGQSDFSEKDAILITYGDSVVGKEPNNLMYLTDILKTYVKDNLSAVHILPMFPYTSDDGFSVVDYKAIDKAVGTWDDIEHLGQDYDLMFDAVINHISKSSDWFQKCLSGNEKYAGYFIEQKETFDASQVVRPRTSPLFTPFETANGKKAYWSTFSDDQMDINYENLDLATDIMELLVYYASKGSKYIRLDAIGFLWKASGTSCIHHEKTHEFIKVMRQILDEHVPGTMLITETNVPHKENISYFGNGYDEAQMVYQFPLPPLTLYSFMTEDASKLSKWAASLEPLTEQTSYFNFLASHDGIGMRPTEGILTDQERNLMAEKVLSRGGRINYKSNLDGSKSPYELNINYQDALSDSQDSDQIRMKRFIASQSVLFSVVGVPAIYVHSLFGSRNYYYGVETSGINRRINREKLDYKKLKADLEGDSFRKEILDALLHRLSIRKEYSAFSPNALQVVLNIDKRLFAIERINEKTGQKISVLINVSKDDIVLDKPIKGVNLLNNQRIDDSHVIKAFECQWIL